MSETCIGFGERDNRKAATSKHCTNLATSPAGLWCPECEKARRAKIGEQMASITAELEKAREDGG